MTKDNAKKDILALEKAKRRNYTKPLVLSVVFVGVVTLGYKLWENPKILYQTRDMFFKSEPVADVYQSQIDSLNGIVKTLQADLQVVRNDVKNIDFSGVAERIGAIEQVNLNTIKSKADVETVLGVIVRQDKLDAKISDLAKVTNKSALVLMSALLVKDAAERGGEFVYEAEVLSEIAKGNLKIAEEINLVNRLALSGIATKESLKDSFMSIYGEVYSDDEEELDPENWKERIFYQISKIIKVRKSVEAKSDNNSAKRDNVLSDVKDFVLRGEIKRAVEVAKKMLNSDVKENVKFSDWVEKASEYSDFYDAISRISANSLAVMKVEFLNNVK